jgi:hypothetical protein
MTTVPSDSNDRAAYLRSVVLHRCPELTEADLEAVFNHDALPSDVADKIVEVIDLMETKLESLVEALRPPPGQTVVDACRMAMVDLTVEEKALVVDRLAALLGPEEASHQPIQ